MKKTFSIALIFCMLLGIVPAAHAESGAAAGQEIISDVISIIPEEGILPDGEEILNYYAELAMYPERAMSMYSIGEQQLEPRQQALYNALKEQVALIAQGRRSSGVELKWTTESSPLSWTYEELGISMETDNAQTLESLQKALDMNSIHSCLLADLPFDFYWYDKPTGLRLAMICSRTDSGLTISSMKFAFSVAEDYRQPGSAADFALNQDNVVSCYTVNAEKVNAANAAAARAKEIVAAHAGKSDYEKLAAYRAEICALTEYNHDAANTSTESLEYGDPWQLIYVFDGNTETKVVCEGYAKAFQYLCDLSDFADEGTACYTVIGLLTGSSAPVGHTWNIVSLSGSNYLADITNSDEGSIGKDGQLFLAGLSGDPGNGYQIDINGSMLTYTYSDSSKQLYGSMTISAAAYDPNGGGTEPEPEAHQHQWSAEWNGDSEYHWHECTAEGCNIADDNSQKGDYALHSWNDGVVTREAGIEAAGIITYTCSVCGETKTGEIPPIEHEHDWPETWKYDTQSHWKSCMAEGCNAVTTEAHKFVDGKCEICQYEKPAEPTPTPTEAPTPTPTETPAEHEHSWPEIWQYDIQSHWKSCTAEGCDAVINEEHKFADGKCEVCQYEKPAEPTPTPTEAPTPTPTPTPTETPAEHVHSWKAEWTKDEGYHWHDCAAENCGISDNSLKEGYAAHDWDDGVVSKEATATETGVMTYTCKTCAATKTAEIPMLQHEHKWSGVWSGTSEYHWHECENSGCGITDNSQKNSYGQHSWDAGTITKEATTTQAGEKTYTCTVCGLKKTEQLPVLPTPEHTHSWSSKWQFSTSHHWNECTAANCPITNNADKYGYALHSFGAWRVVTAATATKDGSMERDCICGYRETKTIPAGGNAGEHVHSWSNWKFTAPNYWERVCSICGSKDIRIEEVTKPKITSGAKSVWRQGSSGGLSFTSSAPLSEFISVTLNGYTLSESYYSKAEGSTVITLNKNCLDQLGVGTHVISINSAGGSAETKFAVKARSQQNNQDYNRPNYNQPWSAPKTGDSANMGLWIGMISVSLIGAAAVAVYVIKKNKRK